MKREWEKKNKNPLSMFLNSCFALPYGLFVGKDEMTSRRARADVSINVLMRLLSVFHHSLVWVVLFFGHNLLGDNTRKQAENREMNETRTHKGGERYHKK
jgi:hypothetical protein